jgi:hypothetical protein
VLAHDLLAASDRATATRALVEAATALQQGGETAGARRLIRRATADATAAGDHHALADLALLRTTRAIERRDMAAALTAAQEARTHALAANAPGSYVGAAVAIAEIAEGRGDRLGAYEALAVGWVTLGDLIGREVAEASFAPRLRALRERWGAEAFAAVKGAYEAQRRAAHGGTSTPAPAGPAADGTTDERQVQQR